MKSKKVVKQRQSSKSDVPKKKIQTIYIQIAAYRDPELLPTLQDCIQRAANPENLRFGIAWQHSKKDKWDKLTEYKNDKRFRIIDIDYTESKGVCWARAQLNALYKNETYTLQLDSHHKFTQNWDTILIEMLESVRTNECPKPLLSSYLPSYEPKSWPVGRIESPWYMEFDRFSPEGPIHFLPHTIDDWKERTLPVPSRFISAHFIFADGDFCKNVPYNPNYYFHGEEIDLSVRAYMAGYNMFAPHKVVVWHEYHRNGKSKHWDDHKDWLDLDLASHANLREYYGIDDKTMKEAVPANVRSLQDYEIYAGVEFRTRRVHKLTIEKQKPPVSLDIKSHWFGLTKYHKVCIDIYKELLKETDYTFWAVALEDENGIEINRRDADKNEIAGILSVPFEQDKFAHIWRDFYHEGTPVKWVVWPYSESKGWGERLTGMLGKQG